jgi:hypothetical protein
VIGCKARPAEIDTARRAGPDLVWGAAVSVTR